MTTQDELRTMVVAYGDVLDGALEPSGPRVGADSGDPQTSGVAFFEGHGVSVGVWECTPGGWAITDRPDTETMMLLAGAVTHHPRRRRPGRPRRGRRLRPAEGLVRSLGHHRDRPQVLRHRVLTTVRPARGPAGMLRA